jgi:hypothetical protein
MSSGAGWSAGVTEGDDDLSVRLEGLRAFRARRDAKPRRARPGAVVRLGGAALGVVALLAVAWAALRRAPEPTPEPVAAAMLVPAVPAVPPIPDPLPAPRPASRPPLPAATPLSPPARVELIASRYTVLARTPTQWVWSWGLTLERQGAVDPVHVRIEFVESRDRWSRLVAYQDLCEVRLPAGAPVTLRGTHTIAAPDARRVTAVTASVSDRSGCPARE